MAQTKPILKTSSAHLKPTPAVTPPQYSPQQQQQQIKPASSMNWYSNPMNGSDAAVWIAREHGQYHHRPQQVNNITLNL